MPGFESLTNGDISSKRRMVGFMLKGFYNSCCDPDQVTEKPFAADVIISNPPAFAHIHVAEALGLPLIISFSKLSARHNAHHQRCRGRRRSASPIPS